MENSATQLASILKRNEEKLLSNWISEQSHIRSAKISVNEMTQQCREFLNLLTVAAQSGAHKEINDRQWDSLKKLLNEISRSRTLQGFSPSETASFVFSLKKPLFGILRAELADSPQAYAEEVWAATTLIDGLGLYSTEAYQKTREELIMRQQEEMLELSTPVVKLWDGILALPMIGTLDSSRTQIVMESLLQKIMETGSEIAIIDITGVPTVDTLVAQHLLKTVTAARLMGAECIISGIRPQIAATIVHLGVNLGDITTKANLADAFQVALSRMGKNISKAVPHRELKA